ncbi:unnamed protein product, partial [Prorocentrum cordatum]
GAHRPSAAAKPPGWPTQSCKESGGRMEEEEEEEEEGEGGCREPPARLEQRGPPRQRGLFGRGRRCPAAAARLGHCRGATPARSGPRPRRRAADQPRLGGSGSGHSGDAAVARIGQGATGELVHALVHPFLVRVNHLRGHDAVDRQRLEDEKRRRAGEG